MSDVMEMTKPNFPALLVVDDFMPNPEQVRQELLAGEFKTEIGPDNAKYTNINSAKREDLIALLERNVGFKIAPLLSFVRADLQGEMPLTMVHSDTVCADYAALLYLNTPAQCAGGTAFWAHRFLGIDALPPFQEVEKKSWQTDVFYRSIREDWQRIELWSMVGFVGMKFNRLAVYPCARFHSRWPHHGFGADVATGRLVWCCFFNRAEVAP